MHLEIDEKTMLRSNECCYEICKKTASKKTGQVTWQPSHYFPDLPSVFKWLIERDIRRSDAKTLSDIVATIESIRDRYDAIWRSLVTITDDLEH